MRSYFTVNAISQIPDQVPHIHYLCRYDTVGVHLIRRGDNSDATGYNKLHYDGYDGSDDPRIMSWMEDLQSASNNIESRLISLERSQKQTTESTEMIRYTYLGVCTNHTISNWPIDWMQCL